MNSKNRCPLKVSQITDVDLIYFEICYSRPNTKGRVFFMYWQEHLRGGNKNYSLSRPVSILLLHNWKSFLIMRNEQQSFLRLIKKIWGNLPRYRVGKRSNKVEIDEKKSKKYTLYLNSNKSWRVFALLSKINITKSDYP